MPRPSDKRAQNQADGRVLVRHKDGSTKRVQPHRIPQLGASWSVVRESTPRKRPARSAGQSTPAVVPDNDSQEG